MSFPRVDALISRLEQSDNQPDAATFFEEIAGFDTDELEELAARMEQRSAARATA